MTFCLKVLRKRFFFIIFSVVITEIIKTSAFAQSGFIPGQSYFGRNQYVEYIAGNYPLIISVPHGGRLEPSEIPDRTCGETTLDANTQELARTITSIFFSKTGKYPHVIINRLHRKKLDANRILGEATCGNQISAISYNEYHGFIDSAKASITNSYSRGLLIDLHGHGHTIQRLELGYLLAASDFNYSDEILNNAYFINKSSIKSLAYFVSIPFSKLIRGETSLGAFFEYKGYPAVPSNLQYSPLNDPYFNGGYITQVHGSVTSGSISAIQLEANYTNVRDNETSRFAFATAFCDVVVNFINLHFFKIPVPEANLSINEVLFDIPPDNVSTPEIEGDANGDGIRSVRGDEFIEIVNLGPGEIDISGFQLLERNFKPVFTFPSNTILNSGEYSVVFGGVGPAGFDTSFPASLKIFAAVQGNADSGFYYSPSKTNLLNSNDNVILFNPKSNTIIDEVCWGLAEPKSKTGKKLIAPNTLYGDSIAGAIQQSVTRSPEKTGLWALHSFISGKPYSPGKSAVISSVRTESVVNKFQLYQNYPNPFNPTTTISFYLPEEMNVKITLYNVMGEKIKIITDQTFSRGINSVVFNAENLSNGIYFYELRSENKSDLRKMVILK